jgi:hypothetical protein
MGKMIRHRRSYTPQANHQSLHRGSYQRRKTPAQKPNSKEPPITKFPTLQTKLNTDCALEKAFYRRAARKATSSRSPLQSNPALAHPE